MNANSNIDGALMTDSSDTFRTPPSGSFMRRVWSILGPYWRSEERGRAWLLLAAVLGLNLGLVYVSVLLNGWNREFYNALEQRDLDAFKQQIGVFCVLAFFYIVGAVYRQYLQQMLEFRWRQWLTKKFLSLWFYRRTYYRVELLRASSIQPGGQRPEEVSGRSGRALQSSALDNPDQRIAEDLRILTSATLSLSLGLISSVVSLVSFLGILWSLSGPLEFMLGGLSVYIPGYMVWVAILYALFGSVLTHKIGRPLVGLNFSQQQREADFRFGLVRVRENAEGIALYKGEPAEHDTLLSLFERVRDNWWQLITKQKQACRKSYNRLYLLDKRFCYGRDIRSGTEYWC